MPLGYRNRVQIHRDGEGRFGYLGRHSHRFVAVPSCPVCVPPLNRLFQAPFSGTRERFTAFSGGDWAADEERDGDRDLDVTLHGRRIAFNVRCFFQSNLSLLEGLVDAATEELSGRMAYDLFCGVGLFGAFLRDRFETVVCVESQQTALDYARRNVTGPSHEYYPMDAEAWAKGTPGRRRVDAVVVDPPRTGLPSSLRESLARMAPGILVYVSCDPVTLSRDVGHFVSRGFRIESVRLFDFYPQTPHVETVARLRPPR
jgi:23S rRNA (uracil1939-C5)-methyltransferase